MNRNNYIVTRYHVIILCLCFIFGISHTAIWAQVPHVKLVYEAFISDTSDTKACHASTIVKAGKNTLVAAWFGGAYEGSADVSIWLARNEGKGWQKPMFVADGKGADGKQYACWNPVLFLAADGVLYLHYKVGVNPREWWAMYKTSTDKGLSWSVARALPEGFLGPVKNKPLQLDKQTVLYPSSVESSDEKSWTVHVETSGSKLQQWKKININNDTFQAIQPSFLDYGNARLQLLARSKQNVIVQSWSGDGGNTWSKLAKTSLPNPNSGIDAATINNSLHVLVYNPLVAGKDWWEGRSVLKVAASKDGIIWTDIYTLENETKGEYSYPAVIADKDGDVYITYTHDRRQIKFVQLKVDGVKNEQTACYLSEKGKVIADKKP